MNIFFDLNIDHCSHVNGSCLNISSVFTEATGHIHGHSQHGVNMNSPMVTTSEYRDVTSTILVSTTTSPAPQNSADVGFFKFVVWGILGSILAVLGFLGNTLSMIVLHRRQMRSSTSYYLLSLAIYDNGILLGMMFYFCLPSLVPYTFFMNDYMDFFSLTLPFGYPISLCAQMGSIYTCVGFTVERFIAVCRPLHAANTCTKSRTIRAISFIFMWSVLYNVPRFFHYKIVFEDENNSPSSDKTLYFRNNSLFGAGCLDNLVHSNQCLLNISSDALPNNVILNLSNSVTEQFTYRSLPNLNSPTRFPTESAKPASPRKASAKETEFGSNPTFKHLYLIYFQLVFMFLLPFLIILIMNIGLIRAVRSSRFMHQSMCASARKEQSLTVMLIAVIVVFLICQFPTIIDNILVALFGGKELQSNKDYMYFWILITFMVEINAASNFLLYCFFGKKFRLMLLSILGIKRKQHQVAYRSTVCKSRTNGTRTYEVEVSVM